MNFNIKNIGNLWDEICNLIIRPQRCIYEPSIALGPKLFTLDNRIFERKDFQLTNSRGKVIECSHYQPIESQRTKEKLPCVIYCHGNCGSRCDALDAVSILLPYNITVFAFDFTGSGLSEGDYVSLGNYEKQDVGTIVEYLWSTKRVSRIGLWGRSMGAATSIMYASIDQSIAGIVVDSPFTSLEDLAMELVHSYQSWIPKKMIKMGINLIRKSIIGKAGFDIRSCAPIECAGSCFVPALFAHAENDDFIKIHHSEKLYETYAGDKNMIRFEGDHNSARPDFMYDSVCIFFYNVLVSNDKELENKDIPKGSMAHKNDVGVVTEKGRQIALEHGEGEYFTDFLDSTSESPAKKNPSASSKISIPREAAHNDSFFQSPSYPQMIVPSSLNDNYEGFGNSDEDEMLFLALIESVKEELNVCKDENERKELETRLKELYEQAKVNSAFL
ncbi:hypothetical protein FDP41_005612 [Naegleria fowleri]|uniref:Serine aminopeptidase S33 domain-containing protein n=1 Tax=Naegleria fowleri TaxID=5763 RepID=A0A6A5BN89_NAEFO|nr:uncharacterized protein FDP41_005612 [Naegleria fowleri]KAF0975618.1 hypothetical protein FDP41_005612 [Naegleria fowleri]CAG4707808.1 unnamed protein product [Naegleria fowleri]